MSLVLLLVAPALCDITLAASGIAHTYTGHGGLSAGASSRLLRDYDPSIQSDILDFLFTPQWGLSLHLIKVEIGGVSVFQLWLALLRFLPQAAHLLTLSSPTSTIPHIILLRTPNRLTGQSLHTNTPGMTCHAHVGMSWT